MPTRQQSVTRDSAIAEPIGVRSGTGRSTVPILPFLFVVAALSYLGLEMAAKTVWGAVQRADQPATGAIGAALPTEFGSLTVLQVENLDGLTAQAVGGMTHGVSGLVLTDRQQVQASVLIVNTSDRRARVGPSQFRLVVDGSPDEIAPTGSTVRPLALAPGARVEATFIFAIPRTQAAISLVYAPSSGAPITVPALAAGGAPAPVDDGRAH